MAQAETFILKLKARKSFDNNYIGWKMLVDLFSSWKTFSLIKGIWRKTNKLRNLRKDILHRRLSSGPSSGKWNGPAIRALLASLVTTSFTRQALPTIYDTTICVLNVHSFRIELSPKHGLNSAMPTNFTLLGCITDISRKTSSFSKYRAQCLAHGQKTMRNESKPPGTVAAGCYSASTIRPVLQIGAFLAPMIIFSLRASKWTIRAHKLCGTDVTKIKMKGFESIEMKEKKIFQFVWKTIFHFCSHNWKPR